MVVVGRRKRFRLFMRLVPRRAKAPISGAKLRRERRDVESKKRGGLLSMLARMARRPWRKKRKKGEKREEKMMRTEEKLKAMSKAELKRVVRMLHESMDRTSRSIAEANLRLCMRHDPSVVFTKLCLSSPLFKDEEAKRLVTGWLKSWAAWWEKEKGVLVVLDLVVTERASSSILTSLENAKEQAYLPMEEKK